MYVEVAKKYIGIVIIVIWYYCYYQKIYCWSNYLRNNINIFCSLLLYPVFVDIPRVQWNPVHTRNSTQQHEYYSGLWPTGTHLTTNPRAFFYYLMISFSHSYTCVVYKVIIIYYADGRRMSVLCNFEKLLLTWARVQTRVQYYIAAHAFICKQNINMHTTFVCVCVCMRVYDKPIIRSSDI